MIEEVAQALADNLPQPKQQPTRARRRRRRKKKGAATTPEAQQQVAAENGDAPAAADGDVPQPVLADGEPAADEPEPRVKRRRPRRKPAANGDSPAAEDAPAAPVPGDDAGPESQQAPV